MGIAHAEIGTAAGNSARAGQVPGPPSFGGPFPTRCFWAHIGGDVKPARPAFHILVRRPRSTPGRPSTIDVCACPDQDQFMIRRAGRHFSGYWVVPNPLPSLGSPHGSRPRTKSSRDPVWEDRRPSTVGGACETGKRFVSGPVWGVRRSIYIFYQGDSKIGEQRLMMENKRKCPSRRGRSGWGRGENGE
jgi:hypothetical protein